MFTPLKRLSSSLLGLGFLLPFFAIAALPAPSAVPRITQAPNAHLRAALPGNTSRYLTSGVDTGALADDERLEHMLLQLQRSPEREQALQAIIDELHDPASPNFHHWLSNKQLFDDYGPAPQDIASVSDWLRDAGFSVNAVSANGMLIDFSGNAGQVRNAFATSLHRYRVKGKLYLSNASDPSIPAALAPVVAGVVSLNNLFPQPQLHDALLPAGTPVDPFGTGKSVAPWNPEFTIGSGTRYLVAPYDFNTIYNVNPVWNAGVTGSGQTIAVIENTDILNSSDVSTFRNAFGIGTAAGFTGTFTQIHPSGAIACNDPGITASEREAALDAEWAGVAAPNAAIEVASCQDTGTTFGGLIAANNLIGSSNPPKILSLSYGVCESQNGATANAAYVSAWQTAAAKGISVFVAAGDEGAASCDADADYASHGIAVSGFASTPYNVAVGGTDFRDTVDGSNASYWNSSNGAGSGTAKSYVPEIPWNSTCASSVLYTFKGYSDGVSYCNTPNAYNSGVVSTNAGSGGASNYSAKPSWQAGVLGIANDSKRDLPDISLFAANGIYGHALLYCMSDTANGGVTCDFTNTSDALHSVGGGTSFAAPALAGIQALVNQATGESWGNMNTRYYALAAQQYGTAASPNTSGVAGCNANSGNAIGSSCVFQDITSGDIAVPCIYGSPNCYSNYTGADNDNCNDYSSTPARSSTCGVVSSSTTSAQPAYAATPGWDFATGLGSVNVANLVTAMLPPATPSKLKFTVQPANASAGSTLATIQVTVQSSSGFAVTGSSAAITLSLANNPGNASLSGTLTANAVNGVATFSNLSLNRIGSGYTFSASSSGLAADTSSGFNISAGAAAKLVYLTQPGNVVAGAAMSPAIQVQVQDANGNPVTSSTAVIALSLANNPGGAHLAGTTASASGGNASFASLSLDKVGTGYTLLASSSGLSSATSAAFAVSAAAASTLVYTVQPPASVIAAAPFSVTLSVQDAFGNSVQCNDTAVTLTLSGAASGASFNSSTTLTTTTVNGQATFNNLAVNHAASGYQLTATAPSLPSAASNSFAVTAAAPAQLVYSTAPAASIISTAPFSISISVQDAHGNVVASDNSRVTLSLSGGATNATLSGATSAIASSGIATFSGLSIDKAGSGYSLIAGDGNLTPGSSSFNVLPAAAAKLVLTQMPGDQSAGTTLAPTITAQVRDASDNLVSSDSSAVSIALSSNPGGSTLSGTTTVHAVNGVASFSDLSLNRTGSGYVLTVQDGSLGSASSAAFSITPASAAQLMFTSQPGDITQGQTLGNIGVALLDSFGNVVSSDDSTVVTLTTPACGGTLLGSQTLVNGVATFAGTTPFQTPANAQQLQASTAGTSQFSAMSNPFAVAVDADRLFFATFEVCTP